MKENFNKVSELIAQSKNILIVSHRAPDEDAVGSALALNLALKKQGIDSSIFISDYSPREYKFLPGYNLISSEIKNCEFDLIFALDYGDIKRLSLDDFLIQKQPTIITIDHHVDEGTNHIGEIKILESASSTSEIIYDYLNESGWQIDKDIATCLLTGIIGDTGGFLHSNTSYKTLIMVGNLLSKGIRINKITKQILNNKTLANNSKLLGGLLSRVEKYHDLNLVYLIVNHDDFESWHKSDLDNLVSTINTVDDCNWALLLVEYEKGKTKGSLRSEDFKGVDVSKIASLFGGGGHKLASGFRAEGRPEEVFQTLIDKLGASGGTGRRVGLKIQ